MNVRLGCLDVVMEIISEGLDMRDNLLAPLVRQMAGKENYNCQPVSLLVAECEQTECDVANLAGARVVYTRDALELEGRIITEEHLWSVLDGSPSGINEFLCMQSKRMELDPNVDDVPAKRPCQRSCPSLLGIRSRK
jgi:hypothetical protein